MLKDSDDAVIDVTSDDKDKDVYSRSGDDGEEDTNRPDLSVYDDDKDAFMYDTNRYDGEESEEVRLQQRLSRGRRSKRTLADGFKKNKVVNEVLDKPTVMTLYKMIAGGVLSGVNGPVSAGKESVVFWGHDADGADVALKIYLVSTSNFKRRQTYIDGDPRFSTVRKGTRSLVYLWAKKEFRNLVRCMNMGIPVPKPIHVANNVLVMRFVGSGDAPGRPAKTLLSSQVNEQDYDEVISILKNMYCKAGLVHGDYSEYNIFKVPDHGLIMFDLGSAVDRRHPNSLTLLRRDINNVTRFFKKRGVQVKDATHMVEEFEVQ